MPSSPASSNARTSLAAALACLGTGLLIGAAVARLGLSALEHAHTLEVLSECALVICLSCAGVTLAEGLERSIHDGSLRLALIAMPTTIALIAGVANVFLGLPFNEGMLLGAILAPTDAVLAGSLPVMPDGASRQVLVAEGALTSSLALPAVLFALGLCGDHDLGPGALRWVMVDVVWASASGVALGWAAGAGAAFALARLESRGPFGALELLVLACTATLAYGAALPLHANGLLCVLVAGVALSFRGRLAPRSPPTARLARRLAAGARRTEQAAGLAIVAGVGALLAVSDVRPALILFALLVIVGVRPLAAHLALGSLQGHELDRRAIAWFGVRGLAPIYLLMFAVNQGVDGRTASELIAVTVAVLATSIALHGLTALPLGNRPVDPQRQH